jgi:hypothetical protein
MLSETRGPVTQFKTQNDLILFIFLSSLYIYILQTKVIYQYVIQQLSKYTIKHKFIPHRLHANVFVIIQLKQVKFH